MPEEDRCVCCDDVIEDKFRLLSAIVIFKDTFHQESLRNCVEHLTGLSFPDSKNSKICKICENELITSYKFRLKVLKTQNIKEEKELVSPGKTYMVIDPTSDDDEGPIIIKGEIPSMKIEEKQMVVCELEHNYGGHQIVKNEEEEEDVEVELEEESPYIEIVTTEENPEYYEKTIEDYIEEELEEEYLEEDVSESTPKKKSSKIDSVMSIDASQTKLNFEMSKLLSSRKRSSGSTWDCTLCNYKSKHSKKDLKVHMLRVHFPDEMFLICQFCRKKCATKYELKCHIEKSHSLSDKAKAVCALCNEGFTTGTKLHAHMLSKHTQGERIPCDLCNQTFKTMTNLKMHKKLHESTEDVHECPICPKSFRVMYYLTKHIKDAHSSNPKIFECNECGQTAKSKKDIRLHLTRRHFPECKSYLCVDCGKMFETSHRLSDHIRSWHNREYRYTCDICQRKFIHPASLRIHKSTHSTTSPFSCDECGASFKNMIYLAHHKKIHVTTKEFGCSQCPQFFKTKGYLQTHIKNCHPTEELHCHICGTTYKNLVIFKSHMKMHEHGKSECEICGKSYASENNLRLHRKNAHGLTAKSEKYIEVMIEAD